MNTVIVCMTFCPAHCQKSSLYIFWLHFQMLALAGKTGVEIKTSRTKKKCFKGFFSSIVQKNDNYFSPKHLTDINILFFGRNSARGNAEGFFFFGPNLRLNELERMSAEYRWLPQRFFSIDRNNSVRISFPKVYGTARVRCTESALCLSWTSVVSLKDTSTRNIPES